MSDKQKKGKDEKKKDWTSIKIEEATRGKLRGFSKDIGVGVGEAVKVLIEAKEQAVTEKIEDISQIASGIADIILSSGLLDVKFRGGGIDNAKIDDSCLVIHGFIKVEIPDKAARESILDLITGKLQGKEVVDDELEGKA